jgi:putative two-component system response regulator
VGKVAVPDHILLKNGKLTAEEFAVMKTHTESGGKLLSGSRSPVVQMAERIARTHHEHWNGKGYSQGLKGEEIPIEGRIVGLVDFFDALTSRRPYKDPYPVPVVMQMIERERGAQFDPHLVDLMLANSDDFARLREELGDAPVNGSEYRISERDRN